MFHGGAYVSLSLGPGQPINKMVCANNTVAWQVVWHN